MKYVSELWWRL